MDQTIDPIDVTGTGSGAVVADPRVDPRPLVAERQGDELTLYLFGALSMNVSEEVGRQALEHIGDGVDMVTVDLAGVNFIDSTGVRALVLIHNRATETGGRMMITRPRESARHMLCLVHLDTVIPIGPVHDPQPDGGIPPLPHEDQPEPS